MENRVCIYLRKSRADEELEKALGEGETLAKHRAALLKYAKEKSLNIVEIKEELVSGDSIYFRPKMQELLQEVENGQYSGVLVMDIDRLGRGGMKDQGTILETFKGSHTLIITPSKTYDLDDELDEEMTEFKTFFARRELKVINKRMQGGRCRSVQEGNYIATNAPYGYDIAYIDKCRTLKPNEVEAEIVREMFNMYINGKGSATITKYLNSIGAKTKFGNDFCRSSVNSILKNPIYVGKVTWRKKDIKKSKVPGKVKDTKTRPEDEWIVANGKHPAIVDINVWNKAQKIFKGRYHVPYKQDSGIVNPLAGILICPNCGRKMVMQKNNGIKRIICLSGGKCNRGHRFDEIEAKILEALEEYIADLKADTSACKNNTSADSERKIKAVEKELKILREQKNKLFDFLERGIYTEDVFLERSKNLDERIGSTQKVLDKLMEENSQNTAATTPKELKEIKKAMDLYKKSDVPAQNEILKSLLYKIEYLKKQKSKTFEIKMFPRF